MADRGTEQRERLSGSDASIRTYLKEFKALQSGELKVIVTPWDAINRIIGGYLPGNMHGIVAATGMGKTTLVEEIMAKAAEDEATPTLFSTEMLWGDMIFRQAIRKLSLPFKLPTEYAQKEVDAIVQMMSTMSSMKVLIYDRGQSGIDVLEEMVHEAVTDYDSRLVIVDHIQHISVPNCRRGTPESTAEVSNRLKDLTLRYRIPLLAISQMGRDNAKGKDVNRFLYGSKNSGDFENACSTIMGMEWDGANKMERPTEGYMRFVISKNRWGKCGEEIMKVNLAESPSFVPMKQEDWNSRHSKEDVRSLSRLHDKIVSRLHSGAASQNELRRSCSTTLSAMNKVLDMHPRKFKVEKQGPKTVIWQLVKNGER